MKRASGKTPHRKRVMRAADELLKAVSEASTHYIAGENEALAGSVDAVRHWAGAFREIADDAEAVADFYELAANAPGSYWGPDEIQPPPQSAKGAAS